MVTTNGKMISNVEEGKPKRRRYRATDPDFIPPDGGWGWLIVVACGFSNLSNFPMFQQFGLIFREKFETLGITNAETTTVINLNSAFNSCVGLLSGPIFKTFSYRKVALFGATLVATSLFATAYCESFWAYLVFYAMCYGSGIGITQNANALALNTYFKKKRRIATGLSWSATGLGPIVWPYIITALMQAYGMENTLMLFAAFACHAVMCSLLLQPVHWHSPYRDDENAEQGKVEEKEKDPKDTERLLKQTENNKDLEIESSKLNQTKKSSSLFSSQYLYSEDDRFKNSYEIVETGTPLLARANDGWYSQRSSLAGSRISLADKGGKPTSKNPSGQNSRSISQRPSYTNLTELGSKEQKRELKKRKINRSQLAIPETAGEDCPTEKAPHDLKDDEKCLLLSKKHEIPELPNDEDVLKSAAKKLEEYIHIQDHEIKEEEDKREQIDGTNELKNERSYEKMDQGNNKMNHNIIPTIKIEDGDKNGTVTNKERANGKEGINELENEGYNKEEDKNISFFQKIIIFFDLNLLKDPMYLNLMLGITVANFAEINFSILTPFVLKEFDFEDYQVATFMSVLGALDIVVRLVVPFFAEKINWENKTFFLIGIMMMATGRIILVHTQTYGVSILVAVIIGAGKGLRTIFMALVIPSYVSLDRLPAAAGLQLASIGLLFLVMAPVIGWIRDAVGDYVITLHLLNLTTYATTIAWLVEPYVTRHFQRKNQFRLSLEKAKQNVILK